MTFTDYNATTSGSVGGSAVSEDEGTYQSLGKLKKQYLDYLSTKRLEIDEAKESRRYRHGAHYSSEQVEALRKRKQPVVTFNRISRKIDGVVGLVERLRQDPKAYPRTPKQEQGAELATAVIRYVLDEQEWKAKSPIVGSDGATEGIGGIEINIEAGDKGDKEVAFEIVNPDSFFYDPRSARLDFSDARFMGVGKWMDLDQAKEMFPDKADELEASSYSGQELTANPDREQKWFISASKRVRVVDHWYLWKGQWCFCIYTGAMKLMEGKSYLFDEKNKTICKYVMFSANVDHDGDRYGFVRQLKSAQDEYNSRRSKGLHELNTRRIVAETGAFDDIEVARREAARPDGIVIKNKGFEAAFDDTARIANIEGQFKFMEHAATEIENFGPNPAILGQGVENKSGRAIQLLQQAGVSELGPYILAYRGWKIRAYRALFNAVQKHWTAERWIRVTDDNDLAQFIQLNGIGIDPNTGQPTIINAIGSLDVDIILDESQDSINMQADAYDTLMALAQQGEAIPPQVMIELAPLQSSVKKRIMDMLAQAQQAAQQQEQQKMQMELAAKRAPMPDPQQMQDEMAIKAQKQQADTELAVHKQASDAQLEANRQAQEMELARRKAADEIDLKRAIAQGELEIEAERARFQQELDVAMNDHKQHIEKTNAEANAAPAKHMIGVLGQLKDAIDNIAADMASPAEIVRGPDGKAIGVRKGKRQMAINRGADGRVSGVQ